MAGALAGTADLKAPRGTAAFAEKGTPSCRLAAEAARRATATEQCSSRCPLDDRTGTQVTRPARGAARVVVAACCAVEALVLAFAATDEKLMSAKDVPPMVAATR
jgi:hypothetical protein